MKDPKTLLFISGLFAHVCIAENVKATGLTEQGHSASGNDKKVTKREYYAPEYNHERYSYPAYRFEYGVHDPQTGDIKKQYEERDGDSVRGYYSLMEPDGSIRLVEYTADSKNGFQAIVKKIGDSHHPMKVTYHMNTATGAGAGAGAGAADHHDGYAPNYNEHQQNNNLHSLAPVLMHEPDHHADDREPPPPPSYANQPHFEQEPPGHANRPHFEQHQQQQPPAFADLQPHFEPPAYANPQPHFEPPAYANPQPHFESPAYTNHPHHQQHQQLHQHRPFPVYEPSALDYDNRYLQLHQHQLQQHHPPSGYVPYEPQHDTHHYEPPLGHHGGQHQHREPDEQTAFPAAADYEHGGSPPLFAGGLPTAHGDYGSAAPDEYHPAPLQFPATSRDNGFGWPAATKGGGGGDGGGGVGAAAHDEDDDELHRINLDDFQFPAAADFRAIHDDDDDDAERHRRGGLEPSSSSSVSLARDGSAERPEYLRKYFEPDYRGPGGGGGGNGASSFYADDYGDGESNK